MKKSIIKNWNSLKVPNNIDRKRYNLVAGEIEGYIQVTVYEKKDKNPKADVFINKDGEDWINRIYHINGKPTFSETMLDNLCRDGWYYGVSYHGKETFEKYFPEKNENYLSEVGKWQLKIRHKKNDVRIQKIFDRWDKELSVIPKNVLPSFEKFMKKEADGKYFMFFKNKDSKIGYCSHCGKEVPLMKHPKQNKEYRCPSCREKTLFKQQDRVQTLETGWYDGAYAQTIGDMVIIRKFGGAQSYRGKDYKNPHVTLKETVRYIIYKDGTVSRYWYGMYNPRICRWNKNTDKDESWARIFRYDYNKVRNIYVRNIAPIMKNSAWNCWKKKPTDFFRYFIIERQTGGLIEKLAKVGLFNIARHFMEMGYSEFKNNTNCNGKDLGQILKIDKARLKRLCKNDNVDYYKWLLKEKEQNIVYDDSMLTNFTQAGISLYMLSCLPKQMNYVQINNYVLKQMKMSSEDYRQVFDTWKDYLSMAKTNGWDIEHSMIYKPTNLKEMHEKAILFRDGSTMEEEVKNIEEKWPAVNSTLSILKSFSYENDEYCIKVPENVADIVREGHSLQHCIHAVEFYFDRIEKRESYIFFLRKKSNPELSWYTIEVEQNGNILQKRTTGDNQNKDLDVAIPFLKEYQQYFISKMTDKDKALAEKAEKNRKERYKKLREDQKKIWHGKLAGKLLADVLEEDLMIA